MLLTYALLLAILGVVSPGFAAEVADCLEGIRLQDSPRRLIAGAAILVAAPGGFESSCRFAIEAHQANEGDHVTIHPRMSDDGQDLVFRLEQPGHYRLFISVGDGIDAQPVARHSLGAATVLPAAYSELPESLSGKPILAEGRRQPFLVDEVLDVQVPENEIQLNELEFRVRSKCRGCRKWSDVLTWSPDLPRFGFDQPGTYAILVNVRAASFPLYVEGHWLGAFELIDDTLIARVHRLFSHLQKEGGILLAALCGLAFVLSLLVSHLTSRRADVLAALILGSLGCVGILSGGAGWLALSGTNKWHPSPRNGPLLHHTTERSPSHYTKYADELAIQYLLSDKRVVLTRPVAEKDEIPLILVGARRTRVQKHPELSLDFDLDSHPYIRFHDYRILLRGLEENTLVITSHDGETLILGLSQWQSAVR